MTAVFSLDEVTLGYDRRPAVHHLSGSCAAGSLTAIVDQWLRQKHIAGLNGLLTPFQGQLKRNVLQQSDIAYLPQQATSTGPFQ